MSEMRNAILVNVITMLTASLSGTVARGRLKGKHALYQELLYTSASNTPSLGWPGTYKARRATLRLYQNPHALLDHLHTSIALPPL